MQQFEMAFKETEQVFLGWKIAKEDKETYFDAGVRFVEGSKLAQQANDAGKATSNYTTFMLPEASAKFRFTSIIGEEDRELASNNFRNSMSQVSSQLDQADMPQEARDMLEDLIKGLGEVMEDTIEEGIFDGAGSVSVASGKLKVLVGGTVADGNALAAEFKKAAEKIPAGDPNAPTFEFDYDTYKGITLHRMTAPLPDPKAKEAIGDQLMLTIGTGEKSYFIALDSEGDATAKQVVDQMTSAQDVKVPPFEGVVSVGDFMKFVQSIEPNPMLDNAIGTVAEYAGNDRVQLKSFLISRGMIYRFSVDEGVMKTIGAAAKAGGGGGGF